jgi:hypothetical protein
MDSLGRESEQVPYQTPGVARGLEGGAVWPCVPLRGEGATNGLNRGSGLWGPPSDTVDAG